MRVKRSGLIAAMKRECPHPLEQIREAPHLTDPLGMNFHRAPFRVCLDCGLAEEGWGCGYHGLAPRNHTVPEVTREQGFALVIGEMVMQKRSGDD
jgi:hypothetical protein